MDNDNRERLIALAYDCLEATRDDDEQFSFVFRTLGAKSLGGAFFFADLEDFDPYLADPDHLDLPWPMERWHAFENFGRPTSDELTAWRNAVARLWQDLAKSRTCEWPHLIWLTPLLENGALAAYALFDCPMRNKADPYLIGLFDTQEEAEAALNRMSVVRSQAKGG
ncbi:MAG: hypothetical protein KJS97_13085 [Alphaproteobacteria bacterium]|nr:hypothetical protein [Alphaproteobacteria bacterium]